MDGLDPYEIDLEDLSKFLKGRLACGGTVKENSIELQGNQLDLHDMVVDNPQSNLQRRIYDAIFRILPEGFKIIKDLSKGDIISVVATDELIQDQCEYINKKMSKYNHYEISNWSMNKKYESKHNLGYWNSKEWIGIGYGAFGFERKKYYKISGSLLNWKKTLIWNNKKDLYFQTLMMALRTKYGLNLNNKDHKETYDFYKDKLNKKLLLINKKNIKCKNFNLLNTILLDLI